MAQYATTDQDLLNVISDRLLEVPLSPPAPSSTQWTTSDWTEAITQAQDDFIRQSGIVAQHDGYRGDTNTAIGTTPGIEKVDLPQDTIDVLRAAWVGYDVANPVVVDYVEELPREDTWSLDATTPNWEVDLGSPPNDYTEAVSPVPSLYLASPPSDIGKVDLLYVACGQALSNTGVQISIPDDFSPYIIWGALYLLLSKTGEANDPDRAAYCKMRFDEGVALAKAMLYMPFALATEM